jgi:two-component system, chemotaxis family, response regulator Rcp1
VPIKNRIFTILQIEDTSFDVLLTARALADFPHKIHVAKDGEQALAMLQEGDGFNPALRPDLILLDLSLPGLNGYDVLRLIKNDEALRSIPVIVFSTLDTEESRQFAYLHHANSYVAKPGNLAEFTSVIQSITSYWSKTGGFENTESE